METSKDGSEITPPIFRLPTEITVLVFEQYTPDSVPPILLTHVCRLWRHIAVNTASLWTRVTIQTTLGNAHTDKFLSGLSMRLDHTANRLLDVTWITDMSDKGFIATLQLIREKAPFSRWRTLRLTFLGESHEHVPWSCADAFTNLESLHIPYATDWTILSLIDRTTTSHLKVLNLRPLRHAVSLDALSSLAKSLKHISSLRISGLYRDNKEPLLPANVVHLQLEWGTHHPLPHIETYDIIWCMFDQHSNINLRSVTTLIIREALKLSHYCQVVLPALREFKLGTLIIDSCAKLEAPALDTLHFMIPEHNPIIQEDDALSETTRSLLDPGYLLSPNTSIVVDSYLPNATLINLLVKSPKVIHVMLRFDDWPGAQVVLGQLLRYKPEADVHSTENEMLCPRLWELRLDFNWKFSETSVSKEWLLDALKSRRKAGLMAPLSIHVGWKGEGTYSLLSVD